MTPFELHCPVCQAALRVSDPRLLGHKVRCPKCGERFPVEPPPASVEAESDLHALALGRAIYDQEPPTMPTRPNDHDPADARGVAGDMRRLKSNSRETAAELTAFMARMKGRSPQEVLGEVANSGLTRGIATAMVGCAALLAVFTAGPYYYAQINPPPPKPVKATTAEAPTPTAAAPASADGQAPVDPNAPPTVNADVLNKIGVGGALEAPANVNPLDNKDDDILKDLK